MFTQSLFNEYTYANTHECTLSFYLFKTSHWFFKESDQSFCPFHLPIFPICLIVTAADLGNICSLLTSQKDIFWEVIRIRALIYLENWPKDLLTGLCCDFCIIICFRNYDISTVKQKPLRISFVIWIMPSSYYCILITSIMIMTCSLGYYGCGFFLSFPLLKEIQQQNKVKDENIRIKRKEATP